MNNQVLKYLYTQINKSIKDNSEMDFQTFERADKIIIWIVGFSIGIFVLLLNSDFKGAGQLSITELIPNIAIISLIIVILGLLFRVFSFYTQMLYSRIIANFSSYTGSFAEVPEFPTPRKIEDFNTITDIVHFLNEDFGITLSILDYQNFTEEKIKEYRQLNVNYYNALAQSNDVELQMEEYKRQVANHFGMSKDSFSASISNDKKTILRGKTYRIMLICCYILFAATIGTFIFGTMLILNEIIKTNCCF